MIATRPTTSTALGSLPRNLIVAGVAAAPIAALLTIALHGRTTLGGLSLRWASTFTIIALITVAWAIIARAWNRHGTVRPAIVLGVIPGIWRGLVPATVVAAVATVATYASDDLFHALAHEPRLAGTLLPGTILLAGTAPWWVDRRARLDRVAADRARDLATVASLLATGIATAGAWHVVATDDLLRYWAITDAMRAHAPYFVTDGTPGDGGFYLVDLPAYPMLASLAFDFLGHTYTALRTPAIAAAAIFPLAVWFSIRAVGADRRWSVALTLAISTLPHLRTYVLGAAQPDGLLAVLLATFIALVVKVGPAIRGEAPLPLWLALATGSTAAAAVLTRPEGLLFVGTLSLGVMASAKPRRWAPTTWQHLGVGIAAAAGPIGVFSSVLYRDLGIYWPGGWASIASINYVGANLELVVRNITPWYAEAVGISRDLGFPIAVFIVFASVAGMIKLTRQHRVLASSPFAVGLSMAVIFFSPTYLTADLFSPATFYRHIAASLPSISVAFASLGPSTDRAITPIKSIVLAITLSILAGNLFVLATTTDRLRSGELTIYPPEPVLTAAALWEIAPPLPILPIIAKRGGGSTFADTFDYLSYRNTLWNSVQTHEQHLTDSPRGWALATLVFSVGCACAAGFPWKMGQ